MPQHSKEQCVMLLCSESNEDQEAVTKSGLPLSKHSKIPRHFSAPLTHVVAIPRPTENVSPTVLTVHSTKMFTMVCKQQHTSETGDQDLYYYYYNHLTALFPGLPG